MTWVILFIWHDPIKCELFLTALPPWYLLRKSTYIIGSSFKSGFDFSKYLHELCQQMRDQIVLYVHKYANMKDNISMPIGSCRFPYHRKATNRTPTLGATNPTGKRCHQCILAIMTTFALLKLRKKCGSNKLIRKRSHQGFTDLESDENSAQPGTPLVQDIGNYWPPYRRECAGKNQKS